jgi:RNA polymerase sigma-70 factor (ECF subfamily)
MVVTATAAREATLLELVAAGDREAFGTLVRPHLQGLLAFAVRVAPDHAAGEDALQDVLSQAFMTLQRKSTDELSQLDIRPWLFRSVINRVRRLGRQRREVPVGLSLDAGHSPDAEETAGRRALLSVVDAELRKLPRDWRAAILLRHHAGYPPEEIAQILDRPSGTVKAWIHRGMRRVRAALPDDIVEGGYQ